MVFNNFGWNTLTQDLDVTQWPSIILLLAVGLSAIVYYYKLAVHPQGDNLIRENTGKKKDRQFGEWTPCQFNYPPIEPCLTPLAEIKPIPYRPFRSGPYHVTMGIRNMPWDDWIELDNDYERYFRIRQRRIRTRGNRAIRVLRDNDNTKTSVRGGELASLELVHELAEYLSRRYPTSFQVVRHIEDSSQWGWEGLPAVKTITIVALGLSFDLPLSLNDGPYIDDQGTKTAAERALWIAALLVQDDLALMIEGQDGKYYFQAGAICLPGFWRLEDKIGLSLDDIHISGGVPQYKEKLQKSMNRYFVGMSVDRAVVRNNYFIQVGEKGGEIDEEEIAWSTTTNGPEDEFTKTHVVGGAEIRAEGLWVRTERQSLRRIGKSGAIVFTIRTYLVNIVAEGLGERMASAVRGWPDEVSEYKGAERWKDSLVKQ